MWSLRVRATSSPSGETTIAVLKPSPSSASARSKSEAWTWTPSSAAIRVGELVGRAAGQLLGDGADRRRAVGLDREVAGEGQLLQADEPGALGGRDLDPRPQAFLVLLGVLVPALLDGADPERLALRRPGAGRRIGRVVGEDQAELLHRVEDRGR